MNEHMKAQQVMPHLIGKTYGEVVAALSVREDQGDCCGWAECSVSDLLAEIPNRNDAVLREVTQLEYEGDCDYRSVVNFVFDLGDRLGLVLGYELAAGSGSGWHYGAYCSLLCEGREVAQASW